jgi:uncharacterized protein (TIGR00299 family) protein
VSSAGAKRRGGGRDRGSRVLHLDTFSGIAGNMFLGALLDLGLSRKILVDDLAGLGLDHALRITKVRRGALAARYLEVRVPAAGRKPSSSKQTSRKKTTGKKAHGHHHHPHHGRTYVEIRRLLERARLDEAVRGRALAIFEALARAEAHVHGTPIEEVHFHEVGAVDAIVDVTGAAIGIERLGIERITATPVALGEGTVETDHGRLPLPAPATLELLRGIPTGPAHVAWETVTPTGAAILRTQVDEFRTLPAMTVESIGHGAGNDRPGPMPNVLRAVLGREAGMGADRVATLETHVDDLVPEHFDYLMERLFEAGALDVSLQHLQMKKNRPGFLVRVVARPSERGALARLLLSESTAIGVRVSEADRLVLEREQRRVETPYGRIGVKRVWDAEGRCVVSAEYDECKRAAKKSGTPLRDVIRAAEDAGRDLE